MRIVFIGLVTLAGVALAVAGDNRMTGEKLREMIAGKIVYVSSPLGEIAIRYAANGTMSCNTELALLDGEKTRSDRGRWWIAEDKLCLKWNSWLGGKAHCFTMQMSGGSTLRWRRDDGKSGTARFASESSGYGKAASATMRASL